MASPELSVIIPVHNESANIGPLCAAALPVLNRITPAWEIVFVDDGSRDDTLARIKAAERAATRASARSRSAAISARRSPSRPGSTMRGATRW